MNESRKSLKEIAYALDQKEGTLRTLLEESRIECERTRKHDSLNEGALVERKNEEVLSMAAQGFSKKEISQRLSMTEGEIELIIDLDRTKHRSHNENV
jgi:ATP/maltotriose-dependent transcriptional regulator MalT